MSNETFYKKVGNKYVAVGKYYDINCLPYGCYFVECKKYSKSLSHVKVIPDYTTLQVALLTCKDNICDLVSEGFKNKKQLSNWDLTEILVEAALLTFKEKKKEILDIIKS